MSSLEMSGMKEEEEEDTNIYDTLMQSCRTDPTALTVLNKIFDMEIVKNEQEISKLSKRYIKKKGITEGMCKRRGCIAILLTKDYNTYNTYLSSNKVIELEPSRAWHDVPKNITKRQKLIADIDDIIEIDDPDCCTKCKLYIMKLKSTKLLYLARSKLKNRYHRKQEAKAINDLKEYKPCKKGCKKYINEATLNYYRRKILDSKSNKERHTILYELYLTVDICKEFTNNWLGVGANVHYKAKENAKTSELKLDVHKAKYRQSVLKSINVDIKCCNRDALSASSCTDCINSLLLLLLSFVFIVLFVFRFLDSELCVEFLLDFVFFPFLLFLFSLFRRLICK